MIQKILIANRGEIACRIIKTAKQLGIATVAVYSQADANALHVQLADEAFYIGPSPSKDSYLKIDNIIDVATENNVDAIHPGYGFLSENSRFAKACEHAGIIFIGPPVCAIDAMGSKSAAKKIMEDAGVPLVPGYHGDDQNPETLKQAAIEMGFPVLLKAAAGGGGKGMRQVHKLAEFDSALAAAKRESMNAFDDDIMLVEKYLTQPRHVEIQVFCDQHGNGVYLFERDCSVQRRHQKVIEEAPAPGMDVSLRKAMGEAAIAAAKAINYEGAGTVEFLLDTDGRFYFMEMNTRLQVEHPVTEMITGEDLVAWQIAVAAGHKLPKQQDELHINGHAFEVRVYAEDTDNGFLPATGKLTLLVPPPENDTIRVDTGVMQFDDVSVYYDPMIAKLIVWGNNRNEARLKLLTALRQYHIEGVTTNLEFLYRVAAHPDFANANLSTTFIERHECDLFSNQKPIEDNDLALMTLSVLLQQQQNLKAVCGDPYSPWAIPSAWRTNEVHTQPLTLIHSGEALNVEVSHIDNGWLVRINQNQIRINGELTNNELRANVDGHQQLATLMQHDNDFTLFTLSGAIRFALQKPDFLIADTETTSDFAAPMNGTIVKLMASPGDSVKSGATLLVMEAMKMEHSITAPSDGVVQSYFCEAGDLVDGGTVLLEFTKDE